MAIGDGYIFLFGSSLATGVAIGDGVAVGDGVAIGDGGAVWARSILAGGDGTSEMTAVQDDGTIQ